MRAARLPALLCFLLAFAGMASRDPFAAVDPTDPDVALREGNRLFEEGELEEAMGVYAAGYGRGAPELDPLLAYNLGTTAHHLGRLPEALLWYRRAEATAHGDPWLEDNLKILERSLGVADGPPSAWGVWASAGGWLSMTGVVLSWAALALLAAGRLARRGLLVSVALLSLAAFGSGWLLNRKGPRPAVLLESCPTGTDGLPAGTEILVLPDGQGFRVLGQNDLRCPEEGVGLVKP
jgi:tetratricopeptide (TPR) repeat protein